jgi:uncharacterized protein (TIGR00730 family)
MVLKRKASDLVNVQEDLWRVMRVQSEMVKAIEAINDVNPVVFFGSARNCLQQEYYGEVTELAKYVAIRGFDVVTGGGPGIMEAANKGAKLGAELVKEEHSPLSVGLTVQGVEGGNKYLDIDVNFHYFFVRKFMFLKNARAIVVCPGGFGTLDELFEVLTLMQTKCMPKIPVILYGDMYDGLVHWIRTTMKNKGCIRQDEIDALFTHVKTVEAAKFILDKLV